MSPLKLLSTACFAAAVICALIGLNAFSRDESEADDYLDSQLARSLPADAFVMESRIGFDYGNFAAAYWEHAVYGGNPREAESILGKALQSADVRSQIEKAKAANFYVAPDALRDAEIMRRYERLRGSASELARRTRFSQRFKLAMAYIGGAAILGFIGFRLRKAHANQSA